MAWNYRQTQATLGSDEPTFTIYSDSENRSVARHVRSKADAILIAAAHDVLEACKAWDAILRAPFTDEQHHKAIVMLRAAIAKATGGTP